MVRCQEKYSLSTTMLEVIPEDDTYLHSKANKGLV